MSIPLKIATWNVEKAAPGRSKRTKVVIEALAAVEADIVILTESHLQLAPSKTHVLAASSAAAPDRAGDQRWVCIWVRMHLRHTALPLSGEPERSAATRVVLPNGETIVVVGTVLPWRSDKRSPSARGAQAFVQSLAAQSEDLARLRSAQPDELLCFAGDWNQELSQKPKVGTAAGKNALEQFLVRHELVAVTAGSRDPLEARGWRASIDHIALSRKAASRANDASVWPECWPLPPDWPDHHGVAITLAPAHAGTPAPAGPDIRTVRDHIAWSYANLARAHAALGSGATTYSRTHHMIRARLFKGLRTGATQMRTIMDDEATKLHYPTVCCYCGGAEKLSLDHLIPRIKGGADSADNLIWACRSCNSSKGDRDLLQWLKGSGRFPPLLLLRRYTKLIARFCENEGLLDLPLGEALRAPLPFRLDLLPAEFPELQSLKLWITPPR